MPTSKVLKGKPLLWRKEFGYLDILKKEKEKKEERKKKKTYGEIWFGKTSLNYIYPCGSGTTILAENWLSLYE